MSITTGSQIVPAILQINYYLAQELVMATLSRFCLSLGRDRFGLVVRRSLHAEPGPTTRAPTPFPLSFPVLLLAAVLAVLG